MDILLIDPPYISLKGMPIDRGYSIGLTSLAAYLSSEGIETAILMGDVLVDSHRSRVRGLLPGVNQDVKKYAAGQRAYEGIVNNKAHAVWKDLANAVRETNPRFVGIAYMTPSKHVVERVAGLVKEINRDIKVIVGSFHPTFCPEEVMQNSDIDFVIRGEGEIPLLQLVKELKNSSHKLETVPSIYYRDKEGKVQSNPGVGLFNNLDELPFPARNLVLDCDYTIYRLHSISTTRGCPYTCAFCADRKLWGGKVRRRSVDSAIKELSLLADAYKINYVDIVDGTFTFDRNYLQAFCRAMIDRKLNIKWRCTARYDNLDKDLIQLMKQSNCHGLYFGLESGSDQVLKSIDKKITVEKIMEVSNLVHDSGILSAASVLLGLPDEGKEDIEKTLELMKKVKTDLLDVNTYIPLPGTPLYDSMTEEDKKLVDWRKAGYKSLDSYFCKRIPLDDFKKYRAEAYSIANSARLKTIVRVGAKTLFNSFARAFTKR